MKRTIFITTLLCFSIALIGQSSDLSKKENLKSEKYINKLKKKISNPKGGKKSPEGATGKAGLLQAFRNRGKKS